MKIFTSIVLIGIFFFSLPGCSESNFDNVVVIVKTGVYHRAQCPPVNMARTIIMTAAEAEAKHFKPCPACQSKL